MDDKYIKRAFRLMSKVWGNREGYAFLPWIDGDSSTPAQRRNNYHEGRAFEWPREREAVLAHMQEHTEDDLYWCPNLFEMKRRASNLAREEIAIWADLDQVDPRSIADNIRPTFAWASSPGSYQAIWMLTEGALLASETGGLGQRMTYHIGADLAGWDATQLLRPPYWRNHKLEYKDEYGDKGAPGSMIFNSGPRYHPSEINQRVPEIESPGAKATLQALESEIKQVDRPKVLARIRNKLKVDVKRLIKTKTLTKDEDRSQKLFYIEQSLAEAGCSLSEIVAIVRPTVWNKFKGRNDELKRLQIEASKAIAKTSEQPITDFPIVDDEAIGEATNLYDLVVNAPRPRWLIQDIWTQGGVGFIDGSPKTFKSFAALDMMISVATGEDFLGEYRVNNRGPVLYIQEEDPISTLNQRVAQVGEGKAKDLHPSGWIEVSPGRQGYQVLWHPPRQVPIDAWVMKGITLSDPEWQERLDEQLSKVDYRLLVIDPMGMTVGSLDDRNFTEMTEMFYKPLKQFSSKYNLSIVVVHHTGKSSGDGRRRGAKMLGSQAGFAWQQDALHMDKPSDKDTVVKVFRESKTGGNMFFSLAPKFEWQGPHNELWVPRVLAPGEELNSTGEPPSVNAAPLSKVEKEVLAATGGEGKLLVPRTDDRSKYKSTRTGMASFAFTHLGPGSYTAEEVLEASQSDSIESIQTQLYALVFRGQVKRVEGKEGIRYSPIFRDNISKDE